MRKMLAIGVLTALLATGQAMAQTKWDDERSRGYEICESRHYNPNTPISNEKIKYSCLKSSDISSGLHRDNTILWAKSLDNKDWGDPVYYSINSVFYARNISDGPTGVRAEVRAEVHSVKDNSWKSSISIMDFKSSDQVRFLKQTTYKGQNLSDHLPEASATNEWQPAPLQSAYGELGEILTVIRYETSRGK